MKPKHKIYFDTESIEKEYCVTNNCEQCYGTNQDGEPHGYGCDPAEDFAVDFCDRSIDNMDEDDFNKIRSEYEAIEQENAKLKAQVEDLNKKLNPGVHDVEEFYREDEEGN